MVQKATLHRFRQCWLYTTLILALFFSSLGLPYSPAMALDGRRGATDSGMRLEKRIEDTLVDLRIEVIPVKDWKESRLYEEPDLLVAIKRAPYVNLYGGRSQVEFLLINGGRQLMIEAKRQMVPGSNDEKLAWVYLTAKNAYPDREYLLVIEGDGWRPGAKEWIKRRSEETPGFHVVSPEELEGWIDEWRSPQE